LGFSPFELLAEVSSRGLLQLSGIRKVSGMSLVEDEFSVDGDLEDASRSRTQLDPRQYRGPSIRDLGCRTDSLIEIISRHAVFDDYFMLRVDHLPYPMTIALSGSSAGRSSRAGTAFAIDQASLS